MKKVIFFLIILLSTSFCFGQILFSENGLSLRYEGNEKIGSRYDEYCKTSFDIYRVKGTVINSNSDKAASVTAILNFDGHTCNKIYSNDGSTGGEITNKLYSLDIPGQTKHQSEYWVNRWVKLLPNDEMTAYGNVEVKQGEPCPEPDHYFTYELISSQSNLSNNKYEETITESKSGKTDVVENENSEEQIAELKNLIEKRVALCDKLGSLLSEKSLTISAYDIYCPKTDNDRLAWLSINDYNIEDIEWLQMQVNSLEEAITEVSNFQANDETYKNEEELIELPEFPGGSGAFAQMVIDGINWNNIKGEGEIKVFLKFTVLKDGRIADIEVSGENTSLNTETLNSAALINTLWKPARTKNGEVNCSHTLPIKLRL